MGVNNGGTGAVNQTGVWYHIALERKSSKTRFYVDGTALAMNESNSSGTLYTDIPDTTDYDATNLSISGYYDTNYLLDGQISNFRVVKGTAVYGGNFQRPRAELTNITNTKLLCCQSTSSTTAATVIPTGSITASGDPTATSVSLNSWSTPSITWPTSITWNGGSAPTLASANSYSLSGQVFNLVTADGGSTWYGYEEVNNSNTATSGGEFSLYAWGMNQVGEAGHNNTTRYSSPVQIPGTTWSTLPHQTGDGNHTTAIRSDGTLWIWGNNGTGELGQNQAYPGLNGASSPIQIPGSWSSSGAVSSATLAVKTDGTLWSWGYNGRGGLGINQPTSKNQSSPTQVGSDTTWGTKPYQLGSLSTFNGAIKTDGTLWMWGNNLNGALGQGDRIEQKSPVQVPGTNWKRVTAFGESGVWLRST